MFRPCFNTKTPWGMDCLGLFSWLAPASREARVYAHRFLVLLLTFMAYTFYHMSRRPISVVKTTIANCTTYPTDDEDRFKLWPEPKGGFSNCTSFIDELNGKPKADVDNMLGFLDTSYLLSYAIFMFVSGMVAERVNLRYFISIGMILAGVSTVLFGMGYFWNIHSYWYYIVVQAVGGAFQTTGWPGVVTVVANWFGKEKKGLIFGIWNAHTSVGNIIGASLAGYFVNTNWGLSFVVPGLIIIAGGFIIWSLLVGDPEDLDIDMDCDNWHNGDDQAEDYKSTTSTTDEDNISIENADSMEVHLHPDVVHHHHAEEPAIGFFGAFRIPGVIEFSLCLFFAKLVSYTFLFWLPVFIKETGSNISEANAAYLSTLFDVGGIVGGILAGLAKDKLGKSALVCSVMLVAAMPTLFGYKVFGDSCPIDLDATGSNCYIGNVGLLLFSGLLVNGPYALITTAVSAELGVHPCLHDSARAMATVTAIIDGTGSIGAAIGPFLAGALQSSTSGHGSLDQVFNMLIIADALALLFLTRLVVNDVRRLIAERRQASVETVAHERMA